MHDVNIDTTESSKDFWGTLSGVRRLTSQMRISTEYVYNAAVPRIGSQTDLPARENSASSLEDRPSKQPFNSSHAPSGSMAVQLLRALGCLGVIWGDIGTSPLYTYPAVYQCESQCITPTKEDIKGTLSSIVWSLIIVVIFKYLIVVMRCDFFGEGGIFALLQLIKTESKKPFSDRGIALLTAVAGIGASSMVADGFITPALSVLAAVEGIKDDRILGSSASGAVVPATLVILAGLYAVQFKGTTKVGRVFGPIMLLYFLSLAAVGVYNISSMGDTAWVLEGWSPHYMIKFWVSGEFAGLPAFKTFGSVVLAVTGAEALFADLGHFGKPPIYISWILVVFPSLILNYTGQACYLAAHPDSVDRVFWASVPNAIYIPVWIICTFATVIASQAMITGCYSIVCQGVTLGLLPRLRTLNTDPTQKAQIYIPAVTVLLAIGTLGLVLGFRSASSLAGAYGIAVLVTFCMSDIMLVAAICRVKLPRTPVILILIGLFPFFFLDGTFLAANIYSKIAHGGYIPVIIGTILTALILSWRFGRHATNRAYHRQRNEGDIAPYLKSMPELVAAVASGSVGTTPGTGVFLCPAWVEPLAGDGLPSTLCLFLKITGSVPRRTILLTVGFHKTSPFISDTERTRVVEITPGMYSVSLTFGFAEPLSELSVTKSVESLLPGLVGRDSAKSDDSERVWYYVHSEDIEAKPSRRIFSRVLVGIYSLMLSLGSSAAAFFGIPAQKVVQLGDVLQI